MEINVEEIPAYIAMAILVALLWWGGRGR